MGYNHLHGIYHEHTIQYSLPVSHMNYLKKNTFLSRFNEAHTHPHTFRSFAKHAQVRTGNGKKLPLVTYLREKHNQKETIHILSIIYHKLILKKREILTNFYEKSLSVEGMDIRDTMDEKAYSPMPLNALSNAKYPMLKNQIRNIHYLGILKNTTSDIPNVRPYLCVLEDLFRRWVVYYKLVTPSAIHYFQQDVIGSILSAYTFRASIMNPYLVYSILSRLATSMKLDRLSLFTPTLGWSSYLVGASALSIPLIRYTGIDVLPNVCKKTKKLAQHIVPDTRTMIYCQPSETFNLKKESSHIGQYDIVFFSPPYYKLEQYEKVMDEYETFEDWYRSYWLPTMTLCHRVLRKGGRMAFILSLYGGYEGDVSTMTKLPRTQFHFIRRYPIHNSRTMNQTANMEYLYVYEKH